MICENTFFLTRTLNYNKNGGYHEINKENNGYWSNDKYCGNICWMW